MGGPAVSRATFLGRSRRFLPALFLSTGRKAAAIEFRAPLRLLQPFSGSDVHSARRRQRYDARQSGFDFVRGGLVSFLRSLAAYCCALSKAPFTHIYIHGAADQTLFPGSLSDSRLPLLFLESFALVLGTLPPSLPSSHRVRTTPGLRSGDPPCLPAESTVLAESDEKEEKRERRRESQRLTAAMTDVRA